MSKPSAVKRNTGHVPLRPTEVRPVAVATQPTKGSSLDPNFRTVRLVFWWKKAPDPLLAPRIAQTHTEWGGVWCNNPQPVDVWNEQSHEWTTWWKADYALPLTARVVRELERIRTLPQEEW